MRGKSEADAAVDRKDARVATAFKHHIISAFVTALFRRKPLIDVFALVVGA